MPGLDLSIALTNPLTLDAFDVGRRPDTVNNFGESSTVTTTFKNIRGVVCMASPSDLKRLPEEQRQNQAISIVTRFALRGACRDGVAQDFQPDLVTWAQNNYLVADILNYGRYGTGFLSAIATLTDFLPMPPVTGVNAQSGLPLPVPNSSTNKKHAPLETLDIVRRSYTFPGLPGDPSKYLVFRNGISQGSGFVQVGQVITLDQPLAKDDEFYTYGY